MEFLVSFFQTAHWVPLILFFIAGLAILGKSADIIVDVAVALSLKLKISRLIIGATVISLGTTLPEVCVSVLASLQGHGHIALGNSVGSIICDTALILGLAILIGRIPIDQNLVKRQGWIQLGAGFFLVFFCLKNWSWSLSANQGGHLPQVFGFISLILLAFYLFFSIYWAKQSKRKTDHSLDDHESGKKKPTNILLLKLGIFCLLLAFSSEILILSASEMAGRLNIPESIVAVTIIALGTSLPELVTSITAVRKGFGEIALGNIIGADILNVLLVAGASVAFSKEGFFVEKIFFTRTFPVMLISLVVLRVGLMLSKNYIHKSVGAALFLFYLFFTYLNISDMLA